MPYFFANDNTHYSRWGTVHLHDMLDLKENDLSIYDEFEKGNFVIHESSRIFSGTLVYLIEVPALMQNLDSEDGDMESFLTCCSKIKY